MKVILTAFYRLEHLRKRKTAAKVGFWNFGDRKNAILNAF
jgi:hypothetical protein